MHILGYQKKWGLSHLSHRNPEKSGHSYNFCCKKGGQSYTWQCWKTGLFGTHIHTMPYLGSYSTPPHPPPPPPEAGIQTCNPWIYSQMQYQWCYVAQHLTVSTINIVSLFSCPENKAQHLIGNTDSNFKLTPTSLGPWKFALDMGSSNHWRLIIALGQEANGGNLGTSLL